MARRQHPTTKLSLLRALSLKADVSQTKVAAVLDALAGFAYSTTANVKRGFSIPGIGRMSVIARKARIACNPRTGRKMTVPAKPALSFRFSKAAKLAIIGSFEPLVPEKKPAAGATKPTEKKTSSLKGKKRSPGKKQAKSGKKRGLP